MNDGFDNTATPSPNDGPLNNPDADTDDATLPTSSSAMKSALQELLKFGLLEADRKINLYRTAVAQTAQINQALEPLDLTMRIDDVRGIVFIKVVQTEIEPDVTSNSDDWSHPLVRRRRLTAEQSLMIAILRQVYLAHEQESGIGAGNAVTTVDELTSSLQLYFGASGSETQDTKRTRNLLDALHTHNIVSDIDDNDRVSIRPVITHIADPESLANLLHYYKSLGQGSDLPDTHE